MSKWPLGQGEDAWLLKQAAVAFLGTRPDSAAPLPVAVAVSGGGDSMALLHLLHRAAPHSGFDLRAVTVDHGLRAESAAEAAGVAAFCRNLGIPHETLHWQGPQPVGNLMDQARRARLALIGAWARGQGIGHVALGHTADDQAESFLMNLARRAGLDGLSGIRLFWKESGVQWSRPLAHAPRADLRAYLRRAGVAWIDDPTNDDDRYARVRARQALAALAPLGITVEGLTATISHLSMAQSALQWAVHKVASGVDCQAGALLPEGGLLLGQPQDFMRRLLIEMIRWMNGRDYAPRAAKLFQLEFALIEGRDATLGGVRFQCRNGRVTVTREPRATMGPVPLGQVWDHRWQVTGPGGDGLTVAALGAQGLRQCPDWRATGIPREALVVTPAIWAGDRLIAAPLAGLANGWRAKLGQTFAQFILSH